MTAHIYNVPAKAIARVNKLIDGFKRGLIGAGDLWMGIADASGVSDEYAITIARSVKSGHEVVIEERA